MSDLRDIYKIGDRVNVTYDSYGLGTVVGFSDLGSVQVRLDNNTKNKRTENGKRFSQFGCENSLHKISSNTKEAKAMSNTEFKVGDKVKVIKNICGHGYIIGDTYFITAGVDGSWRLNNQNFVIGRSEIKLVPPSKKTAKQSVVLAVKGHAPKLVIKIGCKEFEYETAEKLANKLLKVAKAVKEADVVSAPKIQDETFTVEDIQNFLAWFKATKKGK